MLSQFRLFLQHTGEHIPSLLFSKDTEVDLIQNTVGKLSAFKVEAGKVICRNFKTSLLEIRFCVFFVR